MQLQFVHVLDLLIGCKYSIAQYCGIIPICLVWRWYYVTDEIMTLKNFIYKIVKPYFKYVLIMLIVSFTYSCYVVFSPYLLKIIIDQLAKGHDISRAYSPASLYVLLYLLMSVGFRASDWAKYQALPNIKRDIALNMFQYIKNHSHDFFQSNLAGAISNKVNDMVVTSESLLLSVDEFFANFISFIIAIVVMYSVSPMFSMVLLIWWLLFCIVFGLFGRKNYTLSMESSIAYSDYAGRLVDIFSNIASVRMFARDNYEQDNLSISIDRLVTKDKVMMQYLLKMRIVQDVTLVLLIAIMMWILIYLYHENMVSIGDFAFIISITLSIFQAMWQSANKIIFFYKDIGRCQQAFSLIAKKHDVTDIWGAKKLQVTLGDIDFCNVSFSYENSSPIFLKKNITIAAGSKVGLVGYSGSGKSTFVNLLLRNYDLDSGKILIDGQDIAIVTQASLRENISVIPQDISLFHRSLMDNIRYGNIKATDDEVINASKLAHCHDFIINLPKGYNTIVGERGVKLSGGQRQRIAIARAFLELSAVLVLDEATSSLDSVTEKKIQRSLKAAMANRTTIVIAHRLSTVIELDRILVFANGKIIEDGSHHKLLQSHGHYAKMWAMQSDGFLPD